MLVTLLILRLLKSKEVKEEQPLNIYSILVTPLVSQPLKSILISEAQFWNNPDKLTCRLVDFKPDTLFTLLSPEKEYQRLVSLYTFVASLRPK